MAKPYFKPIDIGGNVAFYDWSDKGSHPAPREECIPIVYAEFESQVEEVNKSSVSAPGCHRMWNGPDTDAFLAQLNSPGAFKHLSAYRKSLRPQRLADGMDGPARTLLAWRGVQPLGGVVLYNVNFVSGAVSDIISFVSHIAPFTAQAKVTADLMNYLLENSFDVFDAEGAPLKMQVDEWQFPEAAQNRWRDNLAAAAPWRGLLSKHESTFAVGDGVKYRVAYRLAP